MYFSVRGCVWYKSGVREVLIAWQAGRDLAVATKASVKGTMRADRSGLDWPPRETESLMCKEGTTEKPLSCFCKSAVSVPQQRHSLAFKSNWVECKRMEHIATFLRCV